LHLKKENQKFENVESQNMVSQNPKKINKKLWIDKLLKTKTKKLYHTLLFPNNDLTNLN